MIATFVAYQGGRMRRLLIVASFLGLLALASPAAAITNGSPDGNGHPNVGGLVAAQAYSDGTWIHCSGTLIAPRGSRRPRTAPRATASG